MQRIEILNMGAQAKYRRIQVPQPLTQALTGRERAHLQDRGNLRSQFRRNAGR